MSVTTKKRLQILSGTSLKNNFKAIAILSSLALSLIVSAQTKKEQMNDSDLLNSFIQAKGYANTITFTPSNIKQFWIEKTVLSQDDLIKILLNNNAKSVPLKIQLANVDESQDCKVDIISNTKDLVFSILNSDSKTISESTKEEDFITYNIASASFHLEDTQGESFYLQFSSAVSTELPIKKIILSFSKNNNSSFLASPGKLFITDSNCVGSNAIIKKGDANTFSVTGKRSGVISSNKVFVSDNAISISVTVKNIGDQAADIFLGYAPYTKEGKRIDNRNSIYKNNKTTRIISVEKDRNVIIVNSEPEWVKGCYFALDAKEDLSDFPNSNFVDGTIQDVKKIDNDHVEILFSEPIRKDIKIGSLARVQSPSEGIYLYTQTKRVQPGETVELSSTTKKDDAFLRFGADFFCRGTYYVVPVLLSWSAIATEENTVQTIDFSISY